VAEFRLLGAVEVWAAGQRLDTGQPRQRSLLAALLVDAGRLVTPDSLVDRVWGAAAPDGARHAVHTYVARIRRLLDQAALCDGRGPRCIELGAVCDDCRPGRLQFSSGGYLLDVDPQRVDLHHFRQLVDRARNRYVEDAERIRLLREALALWGGEPLAGVPGEWAASVRAGCRGQRLDAAELWAQAELRAGNAAAVVGPLTDLVGEYPFAESLASALVRALHAAGRTAEALQTYRAARQRLVDELGAEPGAVLQSAHRAALRGEDEGAAVVEVGPSPVDESPTPAGPARAVPAQLPISVAGFVGREPELAALDAILAEGRRSNEVVIAAVSGTAGVGKTALAVHWAHRVAADFPDGQLYVNLRGFDPSGAALTQAEAVRGFLDAFDVPPERIPAGLAAQTALYRSLVAGRRVLLVLDNARDADQVRPLLPGSPTAVVVVTSRNQLDGLVATESANPLTLDLLNAADARALLSRRLGASRLTAEPRAVDEIITRCARLPLAMVIMAARAATHPTFPLSTLASELRDARGGLDVFDGGEPATDVRTVLSCSYRTLTPSAARLFRLLSLHPDPDLGVPAAASLAAVPAHDVRPLLVELARAQLVSEQTPGRFAFHDLLRAYASELAHAVDSEEERRAARHRLLDHYLHTAGAANLLLDPHGDPVEMAAPQPGVTPQVLLDAAAALAWFTAEHLILLACVRQAATTGFDAHAGQIARTLWTYFDRRGRWHHLAATQRIALDAARRLGDETAQAHAHRLLGLAYTRLVRNDDADTHLRQALQLYGAIGDYTGQAHICLSLARVYEQRAEHPEALRHCQRALTLYRVAGHEAGQARALNATGWAHAQLGDYELAISCCERALVIYQEFGPRRGEAVTWDSLGFAHHRLGHFVQADECFRQAIELLRETGDRYHEASALTHIGDNRRTSGDLDGAREAWHEAMEILDQLGHPDADGVRDRLVRTGTGTAPRSEVHANAPRYSIVDGQHPVSTSATRIVPPRA
jgi:DNA-binding SARP family transcriptional activator/Flp pilus assembly protein TadD